MSTHACGCVEQPCGCCEGVAVSTPASLFNRPGLAQIAYRVGTHGEFMQTMRARLAAIEIDDVGADGQVARTLRPLQGLTTRDPGDFSIALLDGFATVADVLTFYQERIANEGYLRTATERRSVLELARLVGYALRPGVAASVYLAYTLDEKQTDPTVIASGTRAQSIPGPGESPQTFETSEDLLARREWNNLQVRVARPQNITLATAFTVEHLYVEGTTTDLRSGDALLFVFDPDGDTSVLRTVRSVAAPFGENRTIIDLRPTPPAVAATIARLRQLVEAILPLASDADFPTRSAIETADALLQNASLGMPSEPATWAQAIVAPTDGVIDADVLKDIKRFAEDVALILKQQGNAPSPPLTDPATFVTGLLKPRVPQVANSLRLSRSLATSFHAGTDAAPQLLVNFAPTLADSYYAAWASARVNDAAPALVGVFAMRVSAALFGANVPRQAFYQDGDLQPQSAWPEWNLDGESRDALFLDQLHEAIDATGFAVVQAPESGRLVRRGYRVTGAASTSRTAYGISGKTTRLTFDRDWWQAASGDMNVLRATLVLAQSDPLTLVDEPVTDDVAGNSIELSALFQELPSGRWVIVSGERADIPGVDGVTANELMMVSALTHGYDATLPGDKTHTTLHLATDLAYGYKRESVVVSGNVVHATHGETRDEILGSGDGAQSLQAFTLKQKPLTFVAAPTPEGAQSTLHTWVDDVEWHANDSLAWLGPSDRSFITRTDDDGNTTLVFGNGMNGARLPTGAQNVRARYRNGIGAPGNVQPLQISLLQTRPLGVKSVINPLRASGGADPETRDLARENAPLSVMALDRLVGVQDYADFTRRFAGIAKAMATLASDGQRELLFLTIAGVDDAPIDPTSDLYRNLREALRAFGDADLPLRIETRELKALVLSARISLTPDYRWETVSATVRAQLQDTFGFHRRNLGQPALLGEVMGAIQGVRGVAYVDIDAFGAIPERVTAEDGIRRLVTQAEVAAQVDRLLHPFGDDGATSSQRARARAFPGVDAWPGGSDAGVLRPAELAIFSPSVPDTLILNQIP